MTTRDDNPGNPFDAEAFEAAGTKWVRAQAVRRREALTASGALQRHPSARPDREANLGHVRELRETLRSVTPAQPPAKVRDDDQMTG